MRLRAVLSILACAVLVCAAGCSTARWTFRKTRTPQASGHQSQGSDLREAGAEAHGAYDVTQNADGSYTVRYVGPRRGPIGKEQ